jgi:hypothetical protein
MLQTEPQRPLQFDINVLTKSVDRCWPLSKAWIRSKDNPLNDAVLYVNLPLRLLIQFVAVTHRLSIAVTANE